MRHLAGAVSLFGTTQHGLPPFNALSSISHKLSTPFATT
jgi:hypothetical protein